MLSGFSVCLAAKPAKQLRACYWLVRLGAQRNTCTAKRDLARSVCAEPRKTSCLLRRCCHAAATQHRLRHPTRHTLCCQVVRIASVLGGIVPQAGSTSAALPTETLMPGGPVRLVGVREGALWLLDPRGLPFVIPLSHPGLKARALAAQGQPAAACAVAEQGESCCAC